MHKFYKCFLPIQTELLLLWSVFQLPRLLIVHGIVHGIILPALCVLYFEIFVCKYICHIKESLWKFCLELNVSYRGPAVVWSAAHYESVVEWLRGQAACAEHIVQPPGRPGWAATGGSVGFRMLPRMETLQPLWRPRSQCSIILISKKSVQIECFIV